MSIGTTSCQLFDNEVNVTIKRTHTKGGPIVIRTTVSISTVRDQLMFELLAEMEGNLQAYQLARILIKEALQNRYDTDIEFRQRFDELWEAECSEWRRRERAKTVARRKEMNATARRMQMYLVGGRRR